MSRSNAMLEVGAWLSFVGLLSGGAALLLWSQVRSAERPILLAIPFSPLAILAGAALDTSAPPAVLVCLAAAPPVGLPLYIAHPSPFTRRLAHVCFVCWILCSISTCGALV